MTYEELLESMTEEQRALVKGKEHALNQEAIKHRKEREARDAVLAKVKAHYGVDDITDEFLAGESAKVEEKLSVTEKLRAAERKLAEREVALAKLNGDLSALNASHRNRARDEEVIGSLGRLGLRPEALDAARKLITLDAEYDAEAGAWQYGAQPLDGYLTKWKVDNSYLLVNPVAPGTQRPGQPLVPNAPNAGKFTKAQFESMSAEERKVHGKAIKASIPSWYP